MSNCRICDSKIKKIIGFGKIALVGNFLKKKEIKKNIKLASIIVFHVSMFKFLKNLIQIYFLKIIYGKQESLRVIFIY